MKTTRISHEKKGMCRKTKIIAFLLVFTLAVFQLPAAAQAAPIRSADVSKAGSGNLLVRVSGSYERVSKTKILKRINQIRKEACTKGYVNPATGKKLKSSDYVPMKWSSNLEWIAQLRAAEGTINESHTRPNGKTCFEITYKNTQSFGETLAWNYSGLMAGIEQWYSEKSNWVNQSGSAEAGHYSCLINPDHKVIGIGSFVRDSGGWYCIAAEFGHSVSGSQAQSGAKGKTVQMIEVAQKKISQPKLNAPSSIKVGKTKQLTVICNVSFPGIMGGKNITKAGIRKSATWKSSRPSVISVASNGKIKAKKTGKSTITAKIKNGKTLKKIITVKK